MMLPPNAIARKDDWLYGEKCDLAHIGGADGSILAALN